MRTSTYDRLTEPLSRATDSTTDFVRRRPATSIATLLILGLLVGFTVWIWPELQRTVRIHRM